jgi:hypothetical protein
MNDDVRGPGRPVAILTLPESSENLDQPRLEFSEQEVKRKLLSFLIGYCNILVLASPFYDDRYRYYSMVRALHRVEPLKRYECPPRTMYGIQSEERIS